MWFLFILILINIGCSEVLPDIRSYKKLMKQMTVQTVNGINSSEKFTYCGEYESVCDSNKYLDMNSITKLYGQKGKNPKKIDLYITCYQAMSKCKGSIKMRLHSHAKLEYKKNNKFNFMYTDVTIIFDEEYIKLYNCTTVKPGKEFSAKDVSCYINGEDQLKDYKSIIGATNEEDLIFGENSVLFEDQHMNRINNKGCQMSTGSIVIIVIVIMIAIILIIMAIIKLSKTKTLRKTSPMISKK